MNINTEGLERLTLTNKDTSKAKERDPKDGAAASAPFPPTKPKSDLPTSTPPVHAKSQADGQLDEKVPDKSEPDVGARLNLIERASESTAIDWEAMPEFAVDPRPEWAVTDIDPRDPGSEAARAEFYDYLSKQPDAPPPPEFEQEWWERLLPRATRINPVHDAARSYVELDLGVLVMAGVSDDGGCTCNRGRDCDRPGSHPALKGGTSNVLRARKEVDKAFRSQKSPNVAFATGSKFGIVALLITPRSLSNGTWDFARKSLQRSAFAWRTQQGSLVVVMRAPGDVVILSGFIETLDGVRIVGEDDYVLAPPSVDRRDGLFVWPKDCRPLSPTIAPPVPGEILALCRRMSTAEWSRRPNHANGGGASRLSHSRFPW